MHDILSQRVAVCKTQLAQVEQELTQLASRQQDLMQEALRLQGAIRELAAIVVATPVDGVATT